MSRNFDLMQQAEIKLDTAPRPVTQVSFPIANGNGHSVAVTKDPSRLSQEECLRLVQRVFLVQGAPSNHVVVFAGIDPGNGCSQICATAADILSRNVPGKVCIVDANLRTPALPEYFGVTNHWGLTDALKKEGPISEFAKQLNNTNLWLLSCGSLTEGGPGALNSDRLKARLEDLRKEFDYVLIDVPPLNQHADVAAIGKLADGVVLVLEANSTRKEAAVRVMENLQGMEIRVLGAVLNKRTFPIPEALYSRI